MDSLYIPLRVLWLDDMTWLQNSRGWPSCAATHMDKAERVFVSFAGLRQRLWATVGKALLVMYEVLVHLFDSGHNGRSVV